MQTELVEIMPFKETELVELFDPFRKSSSVRVDAHPRVSISGIVVHQEHGIDAVDAHPAIAIAGRLIHQSKLIPVSMQQKVLDPETGEPTLLANGDYWYVQPSGINGRHVHTGRDITINAHPTISIDGGVVRHGEKISVKAHPTVKAIGAGIHKGKVSVDASPTVAIDGIVVHQTAALDSVDAHPEISIKGVCIAQSPPIRIQQNLVRNPETGDPILQADGSYWVLQPSGIKSHVVHVEHDLPSLNAHPTIAEIEGTVVSP